MKIKLFRIGLMLCLGLFFANVVSAQKTLYQKLVDKFLSNKEDTTRKNSFFPFPMGAYAPETGLEYGVAAIYSFYTDKKSKAVRVSTINFMGTHTTKNQTNVKLTSDVWTSNNDYHFSSEFRYRNFPYNFYGIGANTKEADKDLVDETKLLLTVAADKKLAKAYYLGVNLGFEYYKNVTKLPTGILSTGNYYGKVGGKILHFGLQQIIDTRDKVTYTTKGWYGKLDVNYAPDIWGGQNYSGWYTNFDGRFFTPIADKITLAVNGVYQHNGANKVPFYFLNKLGGEDMMRGYYQGRYRDKNLLALQTEFRYRFMPRFALVAFGGLGTVYGQEEMAINDFMPSYGAGLRYFFDINKGLSLRLDYGFGQKRPNEKRQTGVYFSMSEAF